MSMPPYDSKDGKHAPTPANNDDDVPPRSSDPQNASSSEPVSDTSSLKRSPAELRENTASKRPHVPYHVVNDVSITGNDSWRPSLSGIPILNDREALNFGAGSRGMVNVGIGINRYVPVNMSDAAIRLRAACFLEEHANRNAAIIASLHIPTEHSMFQSPRFGAVPSDFFLYESNLRRYHDLQTLSTPSTVLLPFSQGVSNLPRNLIPTHSLDALSLLQQDNTMVAPSPPSTTSATILTMPPTHSQLELPLCDESPLEPYYKRPIFHLGVDEDPNWLSEFHCFVRSDMIEVFRASNDDVKTRNNSICYHQVGLRCRFCAHLLPNVRAGRASAFPSSIRQIYQSLTMMLRDHFGNCEALPLHTKEKFHLLRDKSTQGATDSKRFWVYSAMKVGMVDSPRGIVIDRQSRATGLEAPPFSATSSPNQGELKDSSSTGPLAFPSDRRLVSEFIYLVISQVKVVHLTEAERIGNRRSLPAGLPGLGCRYCCEHGRHGLSRIFPARRRSLPSKVFDMYHHLRRCTLCPQSVKDHLERTKHQLKHEFEEDQGDSRAFFDEVWNRLGHSNQAS